MLGQDKAAARGVVLDVVAGEPDDPSEWHGVGMQEGAGDANLKGEAVVVEALLKDVPMAVLVEASGVRFTAVGDKQIAGVAAPMCPDQTVADVVAGALSTGQPCIDVFLDEVPE
ncbi:hypothetical protein [Streptomyces sp. AC555_RSS877]|uniref:hypothetical protein n=1 Tax=Streptomyces sp. AC555_RSS877 TaxID=2823688 RepID=UPI001C25FC79|nr:hypothetical protein [Streptomyces sp. AC555_RSS877]